MKALTKWLATVAASVLLMTTLLPAAVPSTAQAAPQDPIPFTDYAPDSILVKLQEGVDPQLFADQYGLKVEKAIGNWQLLQTPMNEAYEYYAKLQDDKNAAFVELNFTTKKVISTVSKTSITDFCLNHDCDEIYKPKIPWQEWIQTGKAHEITKGSADKVIAMIGTGVDIKHPYLADKIVSPYNFVDQNEEPIDEDGLGTMEAGIAAGAYPDDTAMVTMDKEARIMPLKVLNKEGIGKLSDVGEALLYAREKGASVAHLSIDLPYASEFFYEMLSDDYCGNGIHIIIIIVGGIKPPKPEPPCIVCGDLLFDLSNVIYVLPLADDLSRLENQEYGTWAELGMPSENYFAPYANGQFALASGASLASAAVAGATTLTWSVMPEASGVDVATRLLKSANPIEGTGELFTYGMLDAYQAVAQ